MKLTPKVTLDFDYVDREYILTIVVNSKLTTRYRLETREELLETLNQQGINVDDNQIPSI